MTDPNWRCVIDEYVDKVSLLCKELKYRKDKTSICVQVEVQ